MGKLTLGKKFTYVFVMILIAVFVGTFFVLWTIKKQRDNVNTINLAGRQSMLAQKYNKEINAELIPLQLRNSTIKTAEIATQQIVADRTHYTKNVVGKLIKEVPEVHPNQFYKTIVGGIPLPATFVKEVSDIINTKNVYSYDLLSKWNINSEKGLKTAFEREAFEYLYAKKGASFSRFIDHNGLYTFRYATPDIASAQACITCHNNHEKSPKRDFQQGDIMGILVVNIPIGPTNEGLMAFLNASNDNRQVGSDTFRKTGEVFKKTLAALTLGGEAPLNLDMTQFTTLSPPPNAEIKDALNEVRQLWDTNEAMAQKLFKTEINSAEYIAAYGDITHSSSILVKKMNDTVSLYEADSNRRSILLICIQAAAAAIVCAIIGISWGFILNPLIRILREIIDSLSNNAVQVVSASEQISASSQSLSQATSEQAATIEETSSTMEEIASMAKQNADNAQEASKLARACNDTVEIGNKEVISTVEQGNVAVGEMAGAMKNISESSGKIADIIKIIEGIAFQTNLLALNAAVEAARAGEHGRDSRGCRGGKEPCTKEPDARRT
ncbi:MAG: methyl-accepting chemotaxis protein [Candidatus Brocadiaceae bacterium]